MHGNIECAMEMPLEMGGGGVLGQVSDRDAPHRPSTRNATRVKKKQLWSKLYILPNFDEK